jgi:hypothetical protein
MLDSGGAHSMIDLHTAEMLGLDVEKTTATKYFGCFYSASAVPTPYAGRVRGPVEIQFSEAVTFKLKELKVIHYPEPLILIGTDLLGADSVSKYGFSYVGINPKTQVGEVVFTADGGKTVEVCELVQWPSAIGVVREVRFG